MRQWFLNIALALAAVGFVSVAAPSITWAQETDAAHEGHAADGHEEDLGHGNAGGSQGDAAEFKTDLAVYTFVVFLVLLAILSKFAWPQISKALEAREKYVSDQIAAAEAQNQDAKRLIAEHEARLAAAAGEVREMLEEARRDSEHTKSQILEEGRKAAGEELARAVREIERAKEGALHDLAERSAKAVIELSESVIREQLSADRQKAIVRDALGKLTATPSKN